jgi:hypothetical protein
VSELGKPSHPGAAPPTATTPTISGLPPCSRLSSPMRALGRIAARTAPGHARTATRRGSQGPLRPGRQWPQLNLAAASPGDHRGPDLRVGTLSARLERSDMTAPIAFTAAGLLLTRGPLTFERNSRAVDSAHAQRLRLLNRRATRSLRNPGRFKPRRRRLRADRAVAFFCVRRSPRHRACRRSSRGRGRSATAPHRLLQRTQRLFGTSAYQAVPPARSRHRCSELSRSDTYRRRCMWRPSSR